MPMFDKAFKIVHPLEVQAHATADEKDLIYDLNFCAEIINTHNPVLDNGIKRRDLKKQMLEEQVEVVDEQKHGAESEEQQDGGDEEEQEEEKNEESLLRRSKELQRGLTAQLAEIVQQEGELKKHWTKTLEANEQSLEEDFIREQEDNLSDRPQQLIYTRSLVVAKHRQKIADFLLRKSEVSLVIERNSAADPVRLAMEIRNNAAQVKKSPAQVHWDYIESVFADQNKRGILKKFADFSSNVISSLLSIGLEADRHAAQRAAIAQLDEKGFAKLQQEMQQRFLMDAIKKFEDIKSGHYYTKHIADFYSQGLLDRIAIINGSGYRTNIVGKVISEEKLASLAEQARQQLDEFSIEQGDDEKWQEIQSKPWPYRQESERGFYKALQSEYEMARAISQLPGVSTTFMLAAANKFNHGLDLLLGSRQAIITEQSNKIISLREKNSQLGTGETIKKKHQEALDKLAIDCLKLMEISRSKNKPVNVLFPALFKALLSLYQATYGNLKGLAKKTLEGKDEILSEANPLSNDEQMIAANAWAGIEAGVPFDHFKVTIVDRESNAAWRELQQTPWQDERRNLEVNHIVQARDEYQKNVDNEQAALIYKFRIDNYSMQYQDVPQQWREDRAKIKIKFKDKNLAHADQISEQKLENRIRRLQVNSLRNEQDYLTYGSYELYTAANLAIAAEAATTYIELAGSQPVAVVGVAAAKQSRDAATEIMLVRLEERDQGLLTKIKYPGALDRPGILPKIPLLYYTAHIQRHGTVDQQARLENIVSKQNAHTIPLLVNGEYLLPKNFSTVDGLLITPRKPWWKNIFTNARRETCAEFSRDISESLLLLNMQIMNTQACQALMPGVISGRAEANLSLTPLVSNKSFVSAFAMAKNMQQVKDNLNAAISKYQPGFFWRSNTEESKALTAAIANIRLGVAGVEHSVDKISAYLAENVGYKFNQITNRHESLCSSDELKLADQFVTANGSAAAQTAFRLNRDIGKYFCAQVLRHDYYFPNKQANLERLQQLRKFCKTHATSETQSKAIDYFIDLYLGINEKPDLRDAGRFAVVLGTNRRLKNNSLEIYAASALLTDLERARVNSLVGSKNIVKIFSLDNKAGCKVLKEFLPADQYKALTKIKWGETEVGSQRLLTTAFEKKPVAGGEYIFGTMSGENITTVADLEEVIKKWADVADEDLRKGIIKWLAASEYMLEYTGSDTSACLGLIMMLSKIVEPKAKTLVLRLAITRLDFIVREKVPEIKRDIRLFSDVKNMASFQSHLKTKIVAVNGVPDDILIDIVLNYGDDNARLDMLKKIISSRIADTDYCSEIVRKYLDKANPGSPIPSQLYTWLLASVIDFPVGQPWPYYDLVMKVGDGETVAIALSKLFDATLVDDLRPVQSSLAVVVEKLSLINGLNYDADNIVDAEESRIHVEKNKVECTEGLEQWFADKIGPTIPGNANRLSILMALAPTTASQNQQAQLLADYLHFKSTTSVQVDVEVLYADVELQMKKFSWPTAALNSLGKISFKKNSAFAAALLGYFNKKDTSNYQREIYYTLILQHADELQLVSLASSYLTDQYASALVPDSERLVEKLKVIQRLVANTAYESKLREQLSELLEGFIQDSTARPQHLESLHRLVERLVTNNLCTHATQSISHETMAAPIPRSIVTATGIVQSLWSPVNVNLARSSNIADVEDAQFLNWLVDILEHPEIFVYNAKNDPQKSMQIQNCERLARLDPIARPDVLAAFNCCYMRREFLTLAADRSAYPYDAIFAYFANSSDKIAVTPRWTSVDIFLVQLRGAVINKNYNLAGVIISSMAETYNKVSQEAQPDKILMTYFEQAFADIQKDCDRLFPNVNTLERSIIRAVIAKLPARLLADERALLEAFTQYSACVSVSASRDDRVVTEAARAAHELKIYELMEGIDFQVCIGFWKEQVLHLHLDNYAADLRLVGRLYLHGLTTKGKLDKYLLAQIAKEWADGFLEKINVKMKEANLVVNLEKEYKALTSPDKVSFIAAIFNKIHEHLDAVDHRAAIVLAPELYLNFLPALAALSLSIKSNDIDKQLRRVVNRLSNTLDILRASAHSEQHKAEYALIATYLASQSLAERLRASCEAVPVLISAVAMSASVGSSMSAPPIQASIAPHLMSYGRLFTPTLTHGSTPFPVHSISEDYERDDSNLAQDVISLASNNLPTEEEIAACEREEVITGKPLSERVLPRLLKDIAGSDASQETQMQRYIQGLLAGGCISSAAREIDCQLVAANNVLSTAIKDAIFTHSILVDDNTTFSDLMAKYQPVLTIVGPDVSAQLTTILKTSLCNHQLAQLTTQVNSLPIAQYTMAVKQDLLAKLYGYFSTKAKPTISAEKFKTYVEIGMGEELFSDDNVKIKFVGVIDSWKNLNTAMGFLNDQVSVQYANDASIINRIRYASLALKFLDNAYADILRATESTTRKSKDFINVVPSYQQWSATLGTMLARLHPRIAVIQATSELAGGIALSVVNYADILSTATQVAPLAAAVASSSVVAPLRPVGSDLSSVVDEAPPRLIP